LARLVDEAPQCLPEVILLDLNLGDGSGHALLPFIKNVDALSRIPVVILTTSDAPADRFRATKLGANDYMVKPNSFAEFVAMIRRLGPILQGSSQQLAPLSA
jgi:DNA-binding response OmpR family regulator